MRTIAVVLLSGFALSAFAYDYGGETVSTPAACPAGSDASAHYKWQDGRLVRDGQSELQKRRGAARSRLQAGNLRIQVRHKHG